jgi:hypothetical protein
MGLALSAQTGSMKGAVKVRDLLAERGGKLTDWHKGRNILAVKLDDGTILHDADAPMHVMVAQNAGVDLSRIVDGGIWANRLGFVGGRSRDAVEAGKRARAAK